MKHFDNFWFSILTFAILTIFVLKAPENISETSGTDASGAESLSSPFLNSTNATQIPQSQRTASQSQHKSSHDRRQQGDFRRGRRGRGGGRGGLAHHVMSTPGMERISKPSQSSDKMNSVNTNPSNTTSQSAAKGEACELSVNSAQLKQPLIDEEEKPVSKDISSGEDVSHLEDVSKDVSPTILQDRQQEREHLGRGLKRGCRGSGRHYGHWHDRNFKGPNNWDSSGGAGHRGGGHRAREGGAGHHHRGGGSHRGGGRGLHQRVEKEFRKEGVL